jgi:hypothetical protein
MACIYLKIKAKTLAAESRILRAEENRRLYPRLLSQRGVARERNNPQLAKWPHGLEPPEPVETSEEPQERMRRVQAWRLYRKRCKARVHSPASRTLLHRRRTEQVRDEARATHLAIAFLRGKSYYQVEQFADWAGLNKQRCEAIFASMCSMVLEYGYADLPPTPAGVSTWPHVFAYLIQWSHGGPAINLPPFPTQAVAVSP